MSKNTTIQHKRSSVSGNVPDSDQIEVGELAINFPDQTLYTKDANGQIIEVGNGFWTDDSDGNISYEGGAVEVEELAVESGRLTAYADPIPEYVYDNVPGRAFLWRNPVTGTLLGFHSWTDPIARSTDGGATWDYVDHAMGEYGPYVKTMGQFEPAAEFFGTNTDGSMVLFGPGEGNMFSTDDGLTWTFWNGGPKGVLEGTMSILYDEGTDRWRVLGSMNTTIAILFEFEGSDPNTFISSSGNGNWAPNSRAMIMDNGQILFNNFLWEYIQPDGSWKTTMTLLNDASSVQDDNIVATYELHLQDTDFSSGVARPSFNQGKDSQGRNIGVVAYTRANNTLGIRTTLDGQNWTDLSDSLGDLPSVAQDGIASIFWLEEREQWIVFVTKMGKGGTWDPQPGDAYVFNTTTTGDLTSLVDATHNALVGSRVQYVVGSDLGVWIAPQMNNNTNIAVLDITETNPADLDLYWEGEKLALESYVNNLAGNVQTDLSNCIKSKVPQFASQSIGGYSIQLNTEKVEFGYINEYGNLPYQTNQVYLSKQHVTQMSTPQPDDPDQLPTSISLITTEESVYNGRTTLPFTTNNYKPHRFRDKVEIDLDPTEDFDAVNKKYVDSAVNNLSQQGATLDPDNATSSEFIGGSGTESDPFEVSPVSMNIGDTEVHVATVNITGLDAGQVVYVEDLQAETNGDRFTAGARFADESGVLTVNIALNDNPHSASASVYQGKLRIGGTIYINANVGVYNALEGGTVLASPTNTQPAGPVEWKGSGGRILTATYPLVISSDGFYFTDRIETTDNNTEIWTKWAGDPGSGEGIDGPDGETIRGSVTDDVGGAQFFQLTIQKEVSFVFQNFVDSDQQVSGQSESRVSTVYDVNSYVYPSGTTTGDSAQYAVNGGDWQDMPSDSGGVSRSSSTHYMVEGDTFQLRHRNASTPNTQSTFNFIAAGDSANWTTVTADVLTIKQPTIVSPAKDNTIDISPTGPFASSDFEMAEGVDTHTASSWEVIYSEFTQHPTIDFPQYTYGKSLHAIAWNGSVFCAIGEEDSEYNEIHKSVCITSPDGITWTRQTSLESVVSKTINAITWNGSVFCAVGDSGVCATSPDGVTWTEQTSLADISVKFRAIEWNGSVFCAVGNQGVCATSPDGVTWTEQTSLADVMDIANMYGIAWDGNQFCAVGGGIEDGIQGVCATSPDGITWTKRPSFASAVDNRMQAIAWGGNQFCAVGRNGNCATSPDGITWTRQPSFTSAVNNNGMSAIEWNGNQFFAVGSGGNCATSPDGVTWTYRPSLAQVLRGKSVYALAWDGTQFCVVGSSWWTATSSNTVVASLDSDTSALTSWQLPSGLSSKTQYTIRVKHHTASLTSEWSDGRIFETLPKAGVDWVAQPDFARNVLDSSFRAMPMEGMVWNGTQFCAVGAFAGTPGVCVTSPDGITWTRQPSFEPLFPANQTPMAIVWTGSQYCVTGYYSVCATSPDGITWTQRTGLRSALGGSKYQTISGLAWTGSQFCAVGGDGDCATSPDGITWTKQPSLASAVGTGRQIRSLVWNGSQFCAVGNQGVCATSPDGITWTERTGLASVLGDLSVNGGGQSGADMYAISWDGNQFCAVGRRGNCATSPDGITWTQRPSLAEVMSPSMSASGELFDVFWNNDRNEFIAVGASAQCATSPDGITWTLSPRLRDTVGSYTISSVSWDGNQYCVIGKSGACATSPY